MPVRPHPPLTPPPINADVRSRRCLGEHDAECPHCARAHAIVAEIRRNNARLADQHDVFVQDVREGGFGALAAGFGRGALNAARVEDVAA